MTRAAAPERRPGRYDRRVAGLEGRRATGALPGVRGPRASRRLPPDRIPRHVGVMLDGNRRWAKAVGADTAQGYRAGADNIEPLLGWCEEVGVEVVTLWLLSTDNLNRPRRAAGRAAEHHRGVPVELAGRPAALAAPPRRRARPAARLDRRAAQGAPRTPPATSTGLLVNVAVGYGGRREIADAVRSLLHEQAAEGTHARGARRGHRRRAHRRAPLHQGPARPRPGDPHLGRAAARRLPALAERPQRVLLLRGATGPTSGASTSCARSGRTPSASAASAPDRSICAVHPSFGRVAPASAASRDVPSRERRVGKLAVIGRPVRDTSRLHHTAAAPWRRGSRHSGPRARSRSVCAN